MGHAFLFPKNNELLLMYLSLGAYGYRGPFLFPALFTAQGEANSFPVMARRKGKCESINTIFSSFDLKLSLCRGWIVEQ
jgi:hypothetical protein